MDMVKRDRFELLSAYLDGEVTAGERKQVEEWLATDPAVKDLYFRLLKLRSGMRTMPVAAPQSPEKVLQQVQERLQRRSRLAWILGGAIAACAIGSITNLIPTSSRNLQFAQNSITSPKPEATAKQASTSPLMVAINNPVIEIPKTAVSNPRPKLKTVSTDRDVN
ncbi:MAG TPA: transcriptional regulator [Nostocaceae cyanobacterium]|nr:transcriptional regulator [Nostocaceae cyanobacterium]